MPVRFRCAYCSQLLGIARRKAGTVVRCPTCAGQVVVPNSEGGDPRERGPDDEPLFERSDFDDLFHAPVAGGDPRTGGSAAEAAAPAAAPAGAWGTHGEPELEPLDVPRGEAAGVGSLGRPPGIFLSPKLATLLTVVAVVALAVAFGAGLVVGRFM